jgi:hypothetical protein
MLNMLMVRTRPMLHIFAATVPRSLIHKGPRHVLCNDCMCSVLSLPIKCCCCHCVASSCQTHLHKCLAQLRQKGELVLLVDAGQCCTNL